MFSPYKDKIDEVYASIQAYFKIKYYRQLNKYLGIELDLHPNGSIHMRQPYLIQIIINIIPGKYKSIANPNPTVKYPLEKMRDIKQNITLITNQQLGRSTS